MPGLDRWVISYALETLAYREAPGTTPYTLAINLSGTSCRDGSRRHLLRDHRDRGDREPGSRDLVHARAEGARLPDGQFVRNVLRDGADECVVESFAQGYFIAVPRPVSELPSCGNVRKIRA